MLSSLTRPATHIARHFRSKLVPSNLVPTLPPGQEKGSWNEVAFLGRFTPCIIFLVTFPQHAIRKFTQVSKFRSFHKTKQCKHKKKSLDFFPQLSRNCFRILSPQSGGDFCASFAKFFFFFHSNRPRSIYQHSNMLRVFRDKIVTF